MEKILKFSGYTNFINECCNLDIKLFCFRLPNLKALLSHLLLYLQHGCWGSLGFSTVTPNTLQRFPFMRNYLKNILGRPFVILYVGIYG